MKTLMKKILLVLSAVMILIFTAACEQLTKSLDVVGKDSATSFEAVLNAIPEQVKADEMNVGWSLSAPDETARFIWSEDWSRSPLHDVMLELEVQPFLTLRLRKIFFIYIKSTHLFVTM